MTYEELKLSCKQKDFSFIKQHYDEGKLLIQGRIVNESIFEDLKVLVRYTEDIYTDAWDFHFSYNSRGEISLKGIVLHFPEIEIKNSKGRSHIIKDFFVRASFSAARGTNLTINEVEGGRSTLTYAEYSSDYCHSHLSTRLKESRTLSSSVYFASFCLGSGSINEILSDINCEGFTEERVQRFLLELYLLVSWESLDGGPYRYIGDIREHFSSTPQSQMYRSPNTQTVEAIVTKVISNCKESKTPLNLNYKFEDNKYGIILDHKSREALYEAGADLPDTLKNNLYAVKRGHQFFHRSELGKAKSTAAYYQIPIIGKKYVHNGKEYPFIVTGITDVKEEEGENIEVLTLPPTIVESFYTSLTKKIQKNVLRKNTIDRYTN